MQYKPETKNMVTMNPAYILTIPKELSLTENYEIQRTRKILIIILGVCLALSVVGTISAISESKLEGDIGVPRRSSQGGHSFISMLYCSFGIIVTYQYSQNGLRVLVCLGIIMLVIMGIAATIILCLAIGAVAFLNYTDNNEKQAMIVGVSFGAFIFLLTYAVDFILTVIIVKFAFKLTRLIDGNKHLTNQRV
ncbi:unnamed protein product [Adineta steineri]|uniref:Uncharacterized protein n=1 Tax=Adineta steineri TaxID=433720 RepID=A0A815T7U6_9BILA|nr:unnamed protein product [Adineta steineri]CAF1501161.1 unnamed protein product [Adineta steineri]